MSPCCPRAHQHLPRCLLLPVVLRKSAFEPLAVFLLPVVLSCSAEMPVAVLAKPVVLLSKAA